MAGRWCAFLVLGLWVSGSATAVASPDSNSIAGVKVANNPSITDHVRPTPSDPVKCYSNGTTFVDHGGSRDHGNEVNSIITSQSNIDALNNCTTVAGNFVIQSDTLESIVLSSIESIEGTLTVFNCSKLEHISAPLLVTVSTDWFTTVTLSNLPLLRSISLPAWDSPVEFLYIESLPVLTNVTWNVEVLSDVYVNNTGLKNTNFMYFGYWYERWSGPYPPVNLHINDNPDLIEMSHNMTHVNNLRVMNNGPGARIALRELKLARSIRISNASSIGFPSLEIVTDTHGWMTDNDIENGAGHVEISSNPLILFEMPTLSEVGGAFIFDDNTLLSTLDLPHLKTIGASFMAENNTNLNTISMRSLSSLQIRISGPISTFTIYEYTWANRIRGNFYLNSTAGSLDCTIPDQLHYQTLSWDPPGNYSYLCQSITPGSKHDTAKHWKPPYRLHKRGRIALIAIGSILGIILLLAWCRWIIRYERRAHQGRRQPTRTRSPMGVYRERTESVGGGEDHELPSYARVGGPGEVPPKYVNVTTSPSNPVDGASASEVESAMGTPPVYREITYEAEADAYLAANDTSETPVHRENSSSMNESPQADRSPPVANTNTSSAVPPAETVMWERSLLGKFWSGRALIKVQVKPNRPVGGRKAPLWRRLLIGGVV